MMSENYKFDFSNTIENMDFNTFDKLINYSCGLGKTEKIVYSKRITNHLKKVSELSVGPNWYLSPYNMPVIVDGVCGVEIVNKDPQSTIDIVREDKCLYEKERVLAVANLDILIKNSKVIKHRDDTHDAIESVLTSRFDEDGRKTLSEILKYFENNAEYNECIYLFGYLLYYKLIEFVMLKRLETGVEDALSFTLNSYDKYLHGFVRKATYQKFANPLRQWDNSAQLCIDLLKDIFEFNEDEVRILNKLSYKCINDTWTTPIFNFPEPVYSKIANGNNNVFNRSSDVKDRPVVETNDFIMMTRFYIDNPEYVGRIAFNTTADEIKRLTSEESISLMLDEKTKFALFDAFGTDNFGSLFSGKYMSNALENILPLERVLFKDPESNHIYLLYEGDKKTEDKADRIHGIRIYPDADLIEIIYFNDLDVTSDYTISMAKE